MKIKTFFSFIAPLFCHLLISQNSNSNMLDTSTWSVGTGSVTGFNLNGSTSENSRELGLNHIGKQVVLWKASPDATSNADGGWNSIYKTIDKAQTYRLSVWIKKTNSTDGTTYFGCKSLVGSADHTLNLNGTTNTNPYFWYGDLPELGRWYLLVGYVHKNTYSSSVNLGKIYDGVTGQSVSNITDFKFSSSATNLLHRAYLYYDTNTNDRQYFYAPRMELIDGTEWTLNELLSINPDSQLFFVYDNAGNQKQRFYCQVSGCSVPNPPAGKIVSNKAITSMQVEATEDTSILEEEVSLYPNPTKGSVSLSLNSSSDISLSHNVNVYNSAGILVQVIPSQSKKALEIDLTNLSMGMYLVHIHLSNGTSTTKQIIKN